MEPLRESHYAVIFTSRRTAAGDGPAYHAMAEAMVDLASRQPGYLGLESARGEDGLNITVSYWRDEDSIRAWKAEARHLAAQRLGRDEWYESYTVRIARIERAYSFERD